MSAGESAPDPATTASSASRTPCDARRGRGAPGEGEPEQEDRRTERAEEEVLDRALGRVAVGLVIASEHVARQDHELEGDEQDEQVGRAGDEHRPGHREQQDDRELRERAARVARGSPARTRCVNATIPTNSRSRNVVRPSTT